MNCLKRYDKQEIEKYESIQLILEYTKEAILLGNLNKNKASSEHQQTIKDNVATLGSELLKRMDKK